MKNIIILGCTGSIGKNTCKYIGENRNKFKIVGLSAHSQEKELLNIADEFKVRALALSGKLNGSGQITHFGNSGICSMVEETEADIVVNGISGSAGLMPSVSALKSGKNLALANKETVVMAGELIKELEKAKQTIILPVDSEHSALFNLLRKVHKNEVEELILTASGGAFRDVPKEELEYVTLEQALKHPTWKMGRKITIDSATMANKGLEVIESMHLFSFNPDSIKVVLHPQSHIHSLIRTRDNSLYAQISKPNMLVPIQNALTYPEIVKGSHGSLNLAECSFTFNTVDPEKFPLLFAAYETARKGRGYPCAFNAANEAAVAAFIEGKIRFIDIHSVVSETLEGDWGNLLGSFEQVLELNTRARKSAELIIKRFNK